MLLKDAVNCYVCTVHCYKCRHEVAVVLDTGRWDVEWPDLVQCTNKWRAFVKTVMNFRIQ